MNDYENALKAVSECIDMLYTLPESKKATSMIRKLYKIKADLAAVVEKDRVLASIRPAVTE